MDYRQTADHLLEALRHARLDHSYEVELRKRLSVDLLLIDDFGIEAMTAEESRDIYTFLTERHRRASMIVISNRGSDEWTDELRPRRTIGQPHTRAITCAT